MKKYLTVFKISISEIIAEKETLFVWSISSALGLIGIMVTWLASDKTVIGGYTKSQLISYYFLIYMLEQVIGWWVFWDVREVIMDGTISNYLLKPLSYFKHLFFHELAYKVINFVTHIIVGTFLIISLREYLEFSLSIELLLKLLPVILIGIGINFFIHFLMGCATFFWTESQFLSDFNWMLGLLLGGSMLPLSFFPQTLWGIIKLNPFRYTFSFPAEIIFHKVTSSEYLFGVLIGSLWVILFLILSSWTWKAGLKKYSAFGS